jgi:hypothetical protein
MKRRTLLVGGLAMPAVLRRARGAYNAPMLVVHPQIISNGGAVPEVSPTVTNQTLWETRVSVKNGAFAAQDIRFALYTGYIDSAGGGELPLGNPVTIQAALEQTSIGRAILATFGGSTILTTAPSTVMVLTGLIGAALAANEVFKVQLQETVTLGDNIAISRFNAASVGNAGFDSFRSQVSPGQVGTPGVWSSAGRLSGNGGPLVAAIIGTPAQNYPSCVMLGDSNLVGRDDTVPDANGNWGHICKALYTAGPGGSSVPVANLAQSGERASTIVGSLGTARSALLRYASHVIMNYGVNDLRAGGQTATQVIASLTSIYANFRARGLQIIEQTIVPWTTSSDGWSTPEGQTIAANFGAGEFRDQVNAFKVSKLADGTLAGLVDINQAVEDQSNPGKWRTNAGVITADGQHCNALGHTLSVTPAQAALTGLRLPSTPVRVN